VQAVGQQIGQVEEPLTKQNAVSDRKATSVKKRAYHAHSPGSFISYLMYELTKTAVFGG